MGEREEFDRIIEGLDLDLGFLDDPSQSEPEPEPEPKPERPASVEYGGSSARSPDVDEEFYRRVDLGPRPPWRRNVILTWIGVLGSPLALLLSSVVGILVPRSIVAALTLVFIASAIYLISQLPDRNPGDDPDDGAVV